MSRARVTHPGELRAGLQRLMSYCRSGREMMMHNEGMIVVNQETLQTCKEMRDYGGGGNSGLVSFGKE